MKVLRKENVWRTLRFDIAAFAVGLGLSAQAGSARSQNGVQPQKPLAAVRFSSAEAYGCCKQLGASIKNLQKAYRELSHGQRLDENVQQLYQAIEDGYREDWNTHGCSGLVARTPPVRTQ